MNERQFTTEASAMRASVADLSWINILLAIWVIISPFVLGFFQLPRSMWNNIATGVLIGILAIIRTSTFRQPGWSWANVIVGIWLIISPFVLAFASGMAMWNNVILGIIIAILAWVNTAAVQTVAA